jgi:hypothetical protein
MDPCICRSHAREEAESIDKRSEPRSPTLNLMNPYICRAHAREEAEAERKAEEDAMVMDVAKGGDGLDDDEPLAVPHLLSDKEVDYIEKEAELAGVPALQKRVKEMRGQMSRLEEMGQKLVESLSNKG